MADERRAHEFDVAIATICFFSEAFAGKFRPGAANPYRRRDAEREKTPAEKDVENLEGWELLKAGLKSMADSRGGASA